MMFLFISDFCVHSGFHVFMSHLHFYLGFQLFVLFFLFHFGLSFFSFGRRRVPKLTVAKLKRG